MSAISAATVDVQLDAVIADNVLLNALDLGTLVPEFDRNLLATNPHIQHAQSTRNGLAIVDIDATRVEVTFVAVGDVTRPAGTGTDAVSFRTPLGTRRVTPAHTPAGPRRARTSVASAGPSRRETEVSGAESSRPADS